ncbi:unnamed protein product [Leptosia nina]|uniref:Trichohyalin-plectin-homology domain-containing protein n=1 Tax=Leptosia nina TaxID=320188 RepID=A0AAV1JEJ5_9NEOP
METLINVDDVKKTADIVAYDSLHLQKVLLEAEERALSVELFRKREKEECTYCTDRQNRNVRYEEELEHEKLVECQKALEREKIAKGMQCTKEDKIQLRYMQKMQMQEKQDKEAEESAIEDMWHQILLSDVTFKEEQELLKAERLKYEMQERRRAYDEQIASANRKRRDALQRQREEENRRIEIMKKRMEEEYFDAIRRKKQQQETNKVNYISGHEQKLLRIRYEKQKDRQIDQNTIEVALGDLRRERQRKLKSLQREKQVCLENMKRERTMVENMQREGERVADEYKREMETVSDSKLVAMERRAQQNKEELATDYRRFLHKRNREIEKMQQNRREATESVKRTAINELELKLKEARQEFEKQTEYRNSLNRQMRENESILDVESISMELKQKPFTKRASVFKDKMKNKINEARNR